MNRAEMVEARVRRAPKYGVFLALGALLGVLTALLVTFFWNGTAEASPSTGVQYSQMQAFGFLALIGIAIGLGVGGAVALVLDRTMGRRARAVAADHETVDRPS